jgi:hypothetical protein
MASSANKSTEMEVLVTVKAYPTVSTKYGEAVCVAGVRLDSPNPEWVRFFPVRYRDLPISQQFKKYEIIRLHAHRHSTDRRRETWRPELDTIQRGKVVPAGTHWPARRRLLEPLIGPTMCKLHQGRKGGADAPSLGLIRPTRIRGIIVKPEKQWSPGQQGMVGQGNLLTRKAELVRPGHAFSYSYLCEEPGCQGHRQKIVDWELGESYRSWREEGDALVDAIKERWLDDMCSDDREPFFFVGDQHTRPGKFLVLGTFYPKLRPHEGQLELEVF